MGRNRIAEINRYLLEILNVVTGERYAMEDVEREAMEMDLGELCISPPKKLIEASAHWDDYDPMLYV